MSFKPFLPANGIGYRRVDLEENHRSTEHIVEFSQAFKQVTVLGDPTISMNKKLCEALKTQRGLETAAFDWSLAGALRSSCSRTTST